ncbi:MAG: nucleic acid/nucleotide deaminase domain-containing protein [Muribaculaceae bacterium]|nr:nucleic acid/nucleotide deaminase domain-containing protein [Muribaculaceae bacterium]
MKRRLNSLTQKLAQSYIGYSKKICYLCEKYLKRL